MWNRKQNLSENSAAETGELLQILQLVQGVAPQGVEKRLSRREEKGGREDEPEKIVVEGGGHVLEE